jgi:hypothetical protein
VIHDPRYAIEGNFGQDAERDIAFCNMFIIALCVSVFTKFLSPLIYLKNLKL